MINFATTHPNSTKTKTTLIFTILSKYQELLLGFRVCNFLIHLQQEYQFQKMYRQLNIVSDHPHIPQQAFLFIPFKSSDPKQKDDFRIGEGKGIRRLLFEGWSQQTYTPYELEKLKQFDDYVQRKHIILDDRWDKSWRMRFLLSTGCNIKKCINDMDYFIKYQNGVQELSFNRNVSKYLNLGVFYLAGRDCHYRPILIFDVEKIIKSGMNEDELIETQTYFFQYVMRNFLIPGQVENWVAIIDANQTGLFSLIGTMKKSFSFLSDTYRSRMFVCYVVRIPSSLSFLWGLAKNVLDEETVRKINFFDQQTVEPLLEYCHPSQLENKFGGALPNIKEGHFWPPRQVSRDYKISKQPVKLLSKQQYTEYYTKKILYSTKFHQQNILQSNKNDEKRDNTNLHAIKRIEKDFKIELEMSKEDTVDYQKEIQPHSAFTSPLNFRKLLSVNKEKIQITKIK